MRKEYEKLAVLQDEEPSHQYFLGAQSLLRRHQLGSRPKTIGERFGPKCRSIKPWRPHHIAVCSPRSASFAAAPKRKTMSCCAVQANSRTT